MSIVPLGRSGRGRALPRRFRRRCRLRDARAAIAKPPAMASRTPDKSRPVGPTRRAGHLGDRVAVTRLQRRQAAAYRPELRYHYRPFDARARDNPPAKTDSPFEWWTVG